MKVEISDLSGGGGGGTENVGPESAKKMPKDAHVMSAILRDMGIAEWEPRVINQLMEFSYSYVTNIIGENTFLFFKPNNFMVILDVNFSIGGI